MNPPLDPALRVMIVEDDPVTRKRLAEAICGDRRTTLACEASMGREAIARLAAVKPDVLLVDLGLPDIHGTEVIRAAARLLPQCDVMVVTVFGDERNVLASIEAGATGYVLKDCSSGELIRHILQLRAGGSPVSPGVARLVLDRMRLAAPEPAASASDESPPLTPREAEVLRLVSRGYTYAEVADKLEISVNTVTTHIKNSYRKLAVHSGAAAVTRATEMGLLSGARES
ncbi:MAG: response regulator transcription factor [Betaproteobacteria bacterium]|nr:response regulator transcription factor [Betaproteobacteria bacterium]